MPGKLEMTRLPHRLSLAVFGVFILVLALLSSAYGVWREIALHQPQFDIIVDVEAPKHLGCFEAYINANYESPLRACLAHDGPSTLILANVPNRISIIRFDSGDEPNVEFMLRSVKFATSANYAPAPSRTLREFRASDIAAWTPHDVTINGDTGLTRTATRDPQFHAKLDLDLAALLGAHPSGIALLPHVSKQLLATLLIELAAGFFLCLVVWATYRRADLTERNYAWIAALCFLGFLLTVVSAFPGHTNYDELFSLTEYWTGKLSDVHPPLHTIVWSVLMDIGRLLSLGPVQQASLMLIVQAALFWSAAGILATFLQTKWLARIFLLALAISPVSLVYLGHIGKDSQLAIALFVAVAWLALAVQRRSPVILALTVIPLFYGFAIRSNGPAAVLPLCFFWVAAAYAICGVYLHPVRRILAAAALSIALFACLLAATRGLSRMAIQNPCCYGEQAFMPLISDLMGLSVRLDKNVVPPEFYEDPNYDLQKIKEHFDPYTLNFDGLKRIRPELYMLSVTSWLRALRDYPDQLIRHRLVLLRNSLGLHFGPPPAPYMNRFYVGARSFQLPERASAMIAEYESMGRPFLDIRNFFESYFGISRSWPVYRLWVYIVVLAAALSIPASRSPAIRAPVIWLTASAVCYLLPYIIFANSAHFRYVWWPALAIFTASILRIDAIVQLRTEARHAGKTSTHEREFPKFRKRWNTTGEPN